ncbi:PREDICTED: uncharacterized protein LOC105964362 [Erythranthe guttata]|uniref:uncharacterized protein LOC105964362 n=1 Tax=Erythranthe guttata TaxID=4155 RepID=UPI00064DE9B8|nr:PREDICTED: uncharacterized protein LOC105964362 [Erythranthe guttata]|eukprot:XP_012844341.1 PREDICTED: uncharacterized protein LOC105964362 [Erythranthe guttata]
MQTWKLSDEKGGCRSWLLEDFEGKKNALNKIRGQDAQEYSLLWDYCETVRARNPGAKLLLRKILYSDPPIFERMYFSLPPMRLGFLAGCRPLIGLDGCFLKAPHGGQLLCAVGRDGNDNLFPISLAVVPVENRESWTWFLGELLEEIGSVEERKWTFISDRQKGLLEAIKDVAPGCDHRFCVRHIYQNFKQKWPALELKTRLWRAASTGNKNEFEAVMVEIGRFDKAAAEYLRKIPPCHWARSYFSRSCKTDVLVNILCESFNSYILEAREKPIISMFEWIRSRLTSRIQTKKAGMEKYEGSICPNILKKINKSQQLARNCFPRWHGQEEFEVDIHNDRYVVDLATRTCTCGLFQLNGYPCHHAWACIADRRYRVEDYVDSWYKKDTYLKVYAYMIHAVPGPKDYIKTSFEPLAAPKLNKKAGRPKKMRRRGPDELQTTSYKKGLTHTCKNCLQLGHNKASCKNPTNPRSKLYKGNPANEEVQNSQGAPPSSSQGPSTSVAPTYVQTHSSTPRSNVSSSVAPSSTQPSSSIQDQSSFVAPAAAPGRVTLVGICGKKK